MSGRIHINRDLLVYQKSFSVARNMFSASKKFTREETCSLMDTIRRSSRSDYANIAEARRRRRYENWFQSLRTIAKAEAAPEKWFLTEMAGVKLKETPNLHQRSELYVHAARSN